ncbi:hypothetical protein EI546_02725 [Aequorivita sp. H23M31]|uniref:Secreted protein n=1 Tax=Aequorivita ciconiae TaxID=2494375 RepID=A0A410G0B1_9FLAO|nr:hypothetical protein [Aequorivita sp. H23M31]QAA80706.1 hypothetical protein EI546_02725 [Aequorivita sp. H23M31]
MLKYFLYGLFVLISGSAISQIELPNNSVRFNSSEPNVGSSTGFEIPVSAPLLSKNKNPNTPNSDLGVEREKQIDMQRGDGLMEYTGPNKAPKAFTSDKEAKPDYGKDMYLGDIKTNSKYVTIQYRDHEYVDGDRVRIFVNGDMIISNVMLEGSFRGFNLPLQDGFNKIDFQALNQGSSGPNTAQLQILDEVGNILATYEWNLLTGNKATAIVVKP